MKTLLSFLLITLTTATFANADENWGGSVISAPQSIHVRDKKNALKEYIIPKSLDTGHLSDRTSLALSRGGAMAMCGDYLGTLADNFTVKMRPKDHRVLKITIKASTADHSVTVYGTCQGETNILNQLQLQVNSGEKATVQKL